MFHHVKKKSIKDQRHVLHRTNDRHALWSTTKTSPKATWGIIPLLLIAGKALASAAISSAAKYGVKKALEKRKKKKVGKITAAQWEANKRRVRQMRSRMGLPPLRTLGMV